jgi:hypothetical protein
VFNDDDLQDVRAFGIPVNPEWLEDARLAWPYLRLATRYGPKNLSAHDRARTELVLFLSELLRASGVPHAMAAAWNLVGDADPEAVARKLRPGQPLGDLRPDVVLGEFAPLVRSRLKHFGVASDPDAQSAARLGLLEALAAYNPAIDSSVGTFAKLYRHIDEAIRRRTRKHNDALDRPGEVSGEAPIYREGERIGEIWDVTPKLVLSFATVLAIEGAHDQIGRFRSRRLQFPTALWLAETKPPWKKPYVARRVIVPSSPPPRYLPTRPHGPPDFRYRRILEEIRHWPWLDRLCQAVYIGKRARKWKRRQPKLTRVNGRIVIEIFEYRGPRHIEWHTNPENNFDRGEFYLTENDIYKTEGTGEGIQ